MKISLELENIKRGKSTNWPLLHSKLSRLKIDEKLINQAVTIKRYSEKVYRVNIVDPNAFEEIIKLSQPIDKRSRSLASITGNSHAAKVNGALLVATTVQTRAPYVHVLRKDTPTSMPYKLHAVIIENLECFLNFQDTYQFMNQFCAISHDIEDIEFIYAAGNSISNQSIIPYLKEFTGAILCVLDVDIGGLQIYQNLLNNGLSISKMHFVVPHDIAERLQSSRRKATKKELSSLNKFLNISNDIDQLIRLIHYYQTTVEQESYRAK